MRGWAMKRGEVYWVNLEPASGDEIRKRRPAVIVSNHAANAAAHRVQVVPLTSQVSRIYPWEARVQVLGRAAKAMADQIRTVAKERVMELAGTLTVGEMRAVERAVRLQLGLT
jgi:mRNA interferase MazF